MHQTVLSLRGVFFLSNDLRGMLNILVQQFDGFEPPSCVPDVRSTTPQWGGHGLAPKLGRLLCPIAQCVFAVTI